MKKCSVDEAYDRIKKKYNMSVYSAEFGEEAQHKDSGSSAILKYKKFSEIPVAVMLTDEAKNSLDKWLALGDMQAYQDSVLECLRSLFALIKTQAVARTSYSNQFQYNKALVTPVERIDKRLFAKTAAPVKKHEEKKEEFKKKDSMPNTKDSKVSSSGESSLLKPSVIRGELLKGNGYITASCFVPEKVSTYQALYK